jgi:hypothetical protein
METRGAVSAPRVIAMGRRVLISSETDNLVGGC